MPTVFRFFYHSFYFSTCYIKYLCVYFAFVGNVKFNSSTGVLTWVPVVADAGQSYKFNVTVNDSDAIDTHAWTVNVTDNIEPAISYSYGTLTSNTNNSGNMTINVSASLPIEDGEFSFLHCSKIEQNYWTCDCSNGFDLVLVDN